tara:strand:- start:427 stop:1119 length:693 start_codon:yes stop_codon:yes gene_type:complete
MRRVKKYKKYSEIKEFSPYIPTRILKFKRPKWKFFQKKLEFIKKPADSFINPLIKKTSSKNWEKTTDYFKNEVVLKRSLINSFDSSIKFSSLKKGIKKSSKRITKELLLNFLIKPLFRLDILLSRLYFFSSCYHARQFIQSGYVQVNDKKVKNNVLLKKGDIISFNLSKNQKNFDLSNLFTIHLNNNLFYSFVEVDHYTKTLIILKDLNEVSVDDLSLLITDFFDVYKVN